MHVDKAPEGGKFRAVAAAALDGTAGAWGDGDMLCVTLNSSGEIIAAGLADTVGVIWTPEGRRPDLDGGTDYKSVIGGRTYTVFTQCELVEAEVGTSPSLSAGNDIYSEAAGDVATTGTATAVWVGHVLSGGSRIYVNVGLRPAAT